MQAGACPYASDSVWWTRLFVDAVMGDEEVVTELVAAEELTRWLNQRPLRAHCRAAGRALIPPSARAAAKRADGGTALMLQRRAR
jgi:hypothetical protein